MHDIEEERRLCYVAMTRARHTLTLTAALSRTLYGHTDEERELSRFLAEIGPQRYHDITPRSEAKTGRTQPPRLYEQADTEAHSRFRRGARVRHRNFGTGVVLSVEGKGDKMRIRVRFNTGREATFIVGVAPIEVL
jgi:DNA helicase-2/ATP-dependent DNA helicase PcrA